MTIICYDKIFFLHDSYEMDEILISTHIYSFHKINWKHERF